MAIPSGLLIKMLDSKGQPVESSESVGSGDIQQPRVSDKTDVFSQNGYSTCCAGSLMQKATLTSVIVEAEHQTAYWEHHDFSAGAAVKTSNSQKGLGKLNSCEFVSGELPA